MEFKLKRQRNETVDESETTALKLEITDQLEEFDLIDKLRSVNFYSKFLYFSKHGLYQLKHGTIKGQGMKDFSQLLVKKGAAWQYKSVALQTLQRIFDQDKPPLHDLNHINSSLSGFLRSGFRYPHISFFIKIDY